MLCKLVNAVVVLVTEEAVGQNNKTTVLCSIQIITLPTCFTYIHMYALFIRTYIVTYIHTYSIAQMQCCTSSQWTHEQIHVYSQATSPIPMSKFTHTRNPIYLYPWVNLPVLMSIFTHTCKSILPYLQVILSEVTNKRFLWCVIVNLSDNSFHNTLV